MKYTSPGNSRHFALGKVTLAKDAWRDVLAKHGAKEAASQRIGELVGDRRLEKYCVWFLAALAGMPFVVQDRPVSL